MLDLRPLRLMASRRRVAAARYRLAAALLAASIAPPTLGGIAFAQNTDDAAYRTAIDDAVQEFSAGHWEEARALFKRAHELSPNARTLRGMGMAAFEMRLYVQAIRELEAALRETRKPLDAALRANVEQLIGKAREFVGRVRPEVQPAEARLLIDGREPVFEPDRTLLLDVGTHVFSATLDGHKPTNVRVSVEGASDQVVRVLLEPLLASDPTVPAIVPGQPKPEPAAPPEPKPAALASSADREPSALGTYAWIALAGTAAFGATAGVLHFAVGDAQYSDLESDCAPRCSESEIADSGIKTTDALTNVFLGLAIASGLTAGALFAIHAGDEDDDDALAIDVGPGGAALRGQF